MGERPAGMGEAALILYGPKVNPAIEAAKRYCEQGQKFHPVKDYDANDASARTACIVTMPYRVRELQDVD